MAASTKTIKTKIDATKKTSQITKAMNMVSASKLKKAEKDILNYIPFVEKTENIIANLIRDSEVTHPLLEEREVKSICYIIVTSERGLAGPFNNNIFKMLANVINDNDYVVSLGSKGYNYVVKKNYQLVNENPVLLRDDVRYDDVSEIILKCINMYLDGKIDCIKVIYNHYINTLTQNCEIKQVLPINKKIDFDNNQIIYDFEGGVYSILDMILPLYIENLIYGLILDSKASEHASRMTAMTNATDNATELIEKLEIMYNRARQAAITLELTDIISGANAASSN